MDGSHLDDISRKLAGAKSRRGIFKTLLGLAAGAAAGSPIATVAQDLPDGTTTTTPIPTTAVPATTTARPATTTAAVTTRPPLPATTTVLPTTLPPTTTRQATTTATTPLPTTVAPTTTSTTPAPSTTTKKPTTTATTSTTTKKPTTTVAPGRPVIAIAPPEIACGPSATQFSGVVSVTNPQAQATIMLQFVSQAGLAQVVQIPLSPAQTEYTFSFDIPSWVGWTSNWVAVQVTTGWSSAWGQNQPIFEGFQQLSNKIDVGWQSTPGGATVCAVG